MTPKLVNARPLEGYRIEVTFNDGTKSQLDLTERFSGKGGLFIELADPEYFRQFRVDAELETIVWPNGIDICPDVLYALATGKSIDPPDPVKISA